jgi:hypothetical protein
MVQNTLTKWAELKRVLPLVFAVVAVLVAAFSVIVSAFHAGLQAESFLIGFFVGVAGLYLHFQDEVEASKRSTKQKPEGWDEMVAERHNAELECTRMMTKRAEMECQRLAREMEEEARYDPPDE